MINRIGENGSYLRTEVKRDNHEKSESTFTLDYNDKKKKDDNGVKLELSANASVKTDNVFDNAGGTKDRADTLDEIVQKDTLYQSFREKWNELKEKSKEWIDKISLIWIRIWDGKETAEQEKLKAVEKPEVNAATHNKSIKEMNMQEVTEYLSEGGQKKLAKNSDMLTTYNQYGRIVEIDPSEQNKIFHGNKPWKEL